MAKYKSLVELQGSIGDLVFYNLNGIPVVRRKSGFSKEAYESNPNYKKVRENSTEFGHCSKSGKLLRETVKEYIGDCEDQYMYQKFAKVMTQIKDMDYTSAKGKRRIENGYRSPEAVKLLADFQFGKFEPASKYAVSEQAMFTKTVVLKNKTDITQIQLLTIKPDFENLKTEVKTQQHKAGKNLNYEFDFQFDESEGLLLYFLILKNNEEIMAAGFIN
ncbi:MAG: hypothetical protein QM564_01965 [Bergeyella sp.]